MTPAEAATAAWGEVWRYRIEENEKDTATLGEKKADKTEIAAVVAELNSIKKILIAVLLAIVTGSIGLAFAAIQIVSHA